MYIDFLPFLISREFGLNTDIFETNIINIAVLVFGLFNFVGGFLKTSLAERKLKIKDAVEESESQLAASTERFEEAQKQLNQINLIIAEIQTETEKVKSDMLTNEFTQATELITKQFASASRVIQDREQLVIYYVLRQVLQLTLFQAFRIFLVSRKISGQNQSYFGEKYPAHCR
jgi:F-type H+-transporting ATPase subunit b